MHINLNFYCKNYVPYAQLFYPIIPKTRVSMDINGHLNKGVLVSYIFLKHMLQHDSTMQFCVQCIYIQPPYWTYDLETLQQ